MVEHVHNPETEIYERLETATVEASRLRRRLETLAEKHDRQVVRRQLGETEQRIQALQRRLHHPRLEV